MSDDPWEPQVEALGAFLRSQRRLANLSLRQMAERTKVSNAYLSQIERGLHVPSMRVLQSIARALDLSADAMLAHAGLLADPPAGDDASSLATTEAAIRADPELTEDQKGALLSVYRSYLADNRRAGGD
ncbi:MAG TPA: helix-turn-helix transcriptional regulator [Acidimicrobiales bacterium]|jgi:transcriptional regulator with XRE-family HTH domain|nr:helix-turn-helix transcriptional regulator [Acidimicrobiales bacterium]